MSLSEASKQILSKPWVVSLLAEPLIAKLGTANPNTLQPHVTPVWFNWYEGSLYISAFISTRKVRDILRNQRISVLIDDHTPGVVARAVLLEGVAELIDEPVLVQELAKKIYLKYLGEKGLNESGPSSWVIDPENRIIKLAPSQVFAWGPT
jgi:general stress protein 26